MGHLVEVVIQIQQHAAFDHIIDILGRNVHDVRHIAAGQNGVGLFVRVSPHLHIKAAGGKVIAFVAADKTAGQVGITGVEGDGGHIGRSRSADLANVELCSGLRRFGGAFCHCGGSGRTAAGAAGCHGERHSTGQTQREGSFEGVAFHKGFLSFLIKYYSRVPLKTVLYDKFFSP